MVMKVPASFALFVVLALSSAAWAADPAPTPSYTTAQIDTIMHMRDNGDGLADVAKVVGGTRQDVRAAERAEKQRRKAARRAPRDSRGEGLAVASRRL
jgi:hypothetical protein